MSNRGPNPVVRIFLLTWLWSIFAGFYLVAYVFWVPRIASPLLASVPLASLTLALGLGLLYDGFGAALALGGSKPVPQLPGRRLWRLAGGIVLLGYLSVYLPSAGRIVAHWPLDLAITVVSGVIIVAYAVSNK